MNKTKIVLLVSAAALSACATNIANYSPIEIASNSVRRTDTLSGVSEVIAPRFKVKSVRRSGVRAQAQLRTAGPFTDDKNHIHEGGTYLDVSLTYSTATPNPAEARRYDHASWPGGQSALIADYGESVLDCREDVQEIRQYTPIYGAWGYGHIHDDYCGHSYGGYGYYGHGHVHDDNCGHAMDDHDNDTTIVQPTTDPRPIMGTVTNSETRPNRPRRRRPGEIEPHLDGPGTEPDRPRRTNFPATPGRVLPSTPLPRTSLPRTSRGNVPRPYRGDAGSMGVSSPGQISRGPVNRGQARPQVRQEPKSVSRPRHIPKSTPKRVSRPKTTQPKPARQKSETRSKPSVSRPARRSAPRPNRVSRKNSQLNYYPRDRYDYGPTNYVVRRSCDRQENIRIFVPRARIDAAEQRGLLVYLRPRGGQEEVVSLPPNYISGFKLAAWSPEGRQMTMPGRAQNSLQGALQSSQQSTFSKPAHEPSSSLGTGKVDRNKPVIYGGN